MNLREEQMELEHCYMKNQLVKRISGEFEQCEDFDFEECFKQLEIEPKLGFKILTQMCIHKRATVETLVGTVRHHAPLEDITKALEILVEAGMLNWDVQLELFIVQLDITNEVQREIDLYQYPLPMIVRPETVRNNMQTGYLTARYSIILKNNHHDLDVCLDHINRMNQVPLSINVDTVNMISNKWKGLDKQKDDETRADYLRRVKAFHKYDETAHAVMSLLVKTGNRFYLTHGYDKRGRSYTKGHHVNYQGNDWNKAVIEFADGEIVN